MDKKSPKGRKRTFKESFLEDHFWDCSVCTYKNIPGAFKCLMCDVRKGTSTRKARINPDLAAMQVQRAQTPPPPIIPRALREDYRSSNDDESRPGSSASNSSNIITTSDVASQHNSDVPPAPSIPEQGPSNQSTLPSRSAKGSPKPKVSNATQKENNDPYSMPMEKYDLNPTQIEHNDPNVTPMENNDPNATQKENNDPNSMPMEKYDLNPTQIEHNDPNITPMKKNDPNVTQKEHNDPKAMPTKKNDPNVTPKKKNDPDITTKATIVKPPRARAKLRNMDKKNATHHSVTVDAVTFIITEYKLKPKKEKKVKEPATPTTAQSPTPQTNNEDSHNVNRGVVQV